MGLIEKVIGTFLTLGSLIGEGKDNQINEYYSLSKDKEEVRAEYYHQNKKPVEIYKGSEPEIVRASKYELGDGLLGVAFPERNLAMILDTLKGPDFEKVKEHELYHLNHREASEVHTRISTNTLYWTPNPYLSVT
ncbi:MAG: hypothetical protein AABY07_09135 [Nanoarchaeota archaeon]